MTDYQQVDHDPFPVQFVPVDHDPFSKDQDAALASSMTHYPEQPNPAAPYLQFARDFASGGLQRALDLPNNPIGQALQSDAANTALGVMTPMKGAGVLKGAAEAASPGIMAYHGSPHDFDKFDISKIGTGEGAQSFGHGLYFAENPTIAEHYRDTISQTRGTPVQELMAQALKGRTRDEAVKEFRQIAENLKDKPEPRSYKPRYSAADYAEAANRLEQGEQHGRMYQVSINAEPHEFLDWDKPLSEQSEHVQRALAAIPNPQAEQLRQAVAAVEKQTASPTQQERLTNLKMALQQQTTGRSVHEMLGAGHGNEQQSSEALRQAGIPGIRYLDQGSRGIRTPQQARDMLPEVRADLAKDPNNRQLQIAVSQLERDAALPEPTHNYVVFSDKIVDILKKYGLAGVIGAGGYHFKTKPVDHDPFTNQ